MGSHRPDRYPRDLFRVPPVHARAHRREGHGAGAQPGGHVERVGKTRLKKSGGGLSGVSVRADRVDPTGGEAESWAATARPMGNPSGSEVRRSSRQAARSRGPAARWIAHRPRLRPAETRGRSRQRPDVMSPITHSSLAMSPSCLLAESEGPKSSRPHHWSKFQSVGLSCT